MEKSWQDKLYETVARKSPVIIPLFKYLYFAILGVLAVGLWATFTQNSLYLPFYQLGIWFGRVALLLLGIVVLPGILGRFRIEIKITRIITLFRRQLGILVFVLAFSHFNLVRGLPWFIDILTGKTVYMLFEFMGSMTLFLLFWMFLTSNNFSQKKLGRWWKRLHRIVYVVLWLLVLHTGLQRISIWSVFIFAFAAVEVASLIYDFLKRTSELQKTNSSQNNP